MTHRRRIAALGHRLQNLGGHGVSDQRLLEILQTMGHCTFPVSQLFVLSPHKR
jgi:hypothetical protein